TFVNEACKEQPLLNKCCNQNLCAHGGTCTELCDDAKIKFNCTCGRLCQKRRATSCKEQLRENEGSKSGVYQLFDPTTMSMYEVFCDAISEKGFIWTLIESFSFRSNNEFSDKAFYKEYPVNQKAFTWSKFRLSWSRMITTANRSTHVRATCNFNTEELKYRDYLRAKLNDIDVMRLNVRVTARLSSSKQIIGMRYDSFYGPKIGCQFTSQSTGAVRLPGGEDNFRWYQPVNPVHRCVSSDDSTTQWWFGVRHH
ncbi:unnamed protein product, partial [Porites lobata]